MGLPFLIACGNSNSIKLSDPPTAAETACMPGQAQLGVRDGSLQNLCGCNEPAGPVQSTGVLTCTVAVGTVVFFQYIITFTKHAIMSTGTPTFISSPLNNPLDKHPYRTHAVVFATAGTYTFQDAFLPGITGQIVVQ